MRKTSINSQLLFVLFLILTPVVRTDTIKIVNYVSGGPSYDFEKRNKSEHHRSYEKIHDLLKELSRELKMLEH